MYRKRIFLYMQGTTCCDFGHRYLAAMADKTQQVAHLQVLVRDMGQQ